jgi:hypothetical protein
LKLTELKGIAKHFRDQGFNIHLNANKSEMEAALIGIISSLPVGEGPTISGSLQTPIINTSSSSGDSAPVVQNTIPTNTEFMPPRAQSQVAKPPIVPSQAPSAITSKTYPSNIENKLRELNSKKRRIFDEAEAIPGITPIEILDVLRFINTADCSVDAVVDKVVMKRSINCNPKDDDNIAMLERSLYDRAVMESEKERDNIQQRKRQKVTDLKNDIQSEIFSYEDFKPSLLLRGLLDNNKSSANSSCSFRLGDISLRYRGSIMIRSLVFLFDFVAADSRSLELCELISSNIGNLRVYLVEILLLERDAIKFYKDASFPYLLSLMQVCDEIFGSSLDSVFVEQLFRISHINDLSPTQWRKIFTAFNCRDTMIEQRLREIRDSFQKGMFKIPRDGEMVPELFRMKSLLPFIKDLRSSVEEDGIELTDDHQNLGLLSDRESSESEDDFDDDDDDY